MEQTVYFDVTPPNSQEEAIAQSVAIIDGKRYDKDQIIIDFSHITKQQVLQPAEAKFIRLDLKTEEKKIARKLTNCSAQSRIKLRVILGLVAKW